MTALKIDSPRGALLTKLSTPCWFPRIRAEREFRLLRALLYSGIHKEVIKSAKDFVKKKERRSGLETRSGGVKALGPLSMPRRKPCHYGPCAESHSIVECRVFA
jgi:hypothetical protein